MYYEAQNIKTSNYTIQGLTLYFKKITKMSAKQILVSKDRGMQSYKVSFPSLLTNTEEINVHAALFIIGKN